MKLVDNRGYDKVHLLPSKYEPNKGLGFSSAANGKQRHDFECRVKNECRVEKVQNICKAIVITHLCQWVMDIILTKSLELET